MNTKNFNISLLELQDKLYHYALSLTADSESAQDLVQETFLKALTYKDKYRDNTNFKAWIYTIMKNTFINNYRRNVKVRSAFDQNNNEHHINFSKNESFESPDSVYNSKEIQSNIDHLSEEYRIPFTMFLDGYKYKEISDELDLPLGTVKSRIFFTRKKLEKTLAAYAN